ncbi:hypothetical protein PM082_013557 [Marasmius tenuissimus]|nr:hypothetical protein PM082_013557 [Marasmius tenuissimus]
MSAPPAAPTSVDPGVPIIMPFPAFNQLLATTYGVQLAGLFVSCGLFGVFGLQVFIYYKGRARDPFLLKALPLYLLIVEFLHQFLVCTAVYKVLINGFGNQLVAVGAIIPELFVGTMFQAFCASGAQMFYTYRIWKFTSGRPGAKQLITHWVIPCITIPLSAVQLAMTLTNCALTLKHGSLQYLETISWTTYVTHATNAFLDVLFVIAMLTLLHQDQSVFVGTNKMVNRLTVVVINTGLATTVFTLLTIIFLAAKPDTLIYVFFNFMISPLYGNSVLANLNSREFVRGGHDTFTSQSGGMQMNSVKFKRGFSTTAIDESRARLEEASGKDVIKYTTSTTTMHD